jgi:glycine hydroxymethyltransferase
MHVIAAKAVCFGEALQPEFREYAERVVRNAARLADELKARGFELVTGGTSNHLILADVYKSFGIDGKIAERAMDAIGLTLNANAVPDDPLPMFTPSGIRLGTPAATTRGLGEDDMARIAEWMRQAIDHRDDTERLRAIHDDVKDFCRTLV